jgi:hypothetical protein
MWKWTRRRELTARLWGTADPPASERQTGKLPGKTPEIPGRCVGLHSYLSIGTQTWSFFTFSQLEDLLGFALPDSAHTRHEWWTSTDRDADQSSCADARILAGKTAKPNLQARTVTFERPIESLRASRSLA